MTVSDRMLAALHDIVAEAGMQHIKTIEAEAKVFCPFEAVGMVRHEIRHSNFLSYVLDPNRPHGFDASFLAALLKAIAPEMINPSRLNKASVSREKANIDILIEIPSTNGKPGLIIAIEVKVDAVERTDQLSDYERRVTSLWPECQHLFVFLTPSGREPETSGTGRWKTLSWTELFELFRKALPEGTSAIRGFAMYDAYEKMMRRHGMAKPRRNAALEAAVSALWSEHREALEYLIENRPNPINEAMAQLADELPRFAKLLTDGFGTRVQEDSSSSRYKRFWFPDLCSRFPQVLQGGSSWVKSGSIIVLEMSRADEGIGASIVIGPAQGNPAFRKRLLETMSQNDGITRRTGESGWSHNWRVLISEDDLASAMTNEGGLLTLMQQRLVESLRDVLQQDLPKLIDQSCL